MPPPCLLCALIPPCMCPSDNAGHYEYVMIMFSYYTVLVVVKYFLKVFKKTVYIKIINLTLINLNCWLIKRNC